MSKIKFLAILLAAVLIAGAASAAAQERTLAEGNPPLTSAMAARFVALMEWSLDLAFAPDDRAKVERQLVKYWRTGDEKNITAVGNILDFERNLARAGEAKKRELQPQVKKQMLETMERESTDELNAILLEIYRAKREAENAPLAGGGDLSALVGRWQVLHGNSIVGVDAVSGRIGDGNAMVAEFDIRADGRVIYTFVLQQSNFGCTTRIKTSRTGRVAVDGARVEFDYAGGTTTSEDSCNRGNNYTKRLAAEREVYDFRTGRSDSGRPQFCFASAKLKDCAVKVN